MRSEPRGKSGMGSARGGCEMRQGTVRCGSRRRDRYGEFVRGSTRGIGAANRHKQPTRRRLQKGLRRWSARESARRFARSIGAENCAGICVRKLRQKIGTEVCRGGLSQWNYAVGLKIGKAGTGTKKDREKNRGHTGGVEFSRGGFGSHPYRLGKTVVVLSPIAGPGISLIASSGSRNGLYGKLQTLLSSSGLFRPPGSGSLFRFQAAALVSAPGSDLLIRSAPGPGIIRRAAPARARRHQRHRLPESRPAAWRRAPRTRSHAPAASRRPS